MGDSMNFVTTAEVSDYSPIVWSKILYSEAIAKLVFGSIMGPENSYMPVIFKSELLTEAGNSIVIRRADRLGATATTGLLRGSETKIEWKKVTFTPVKKGIASAEEVLVGQHLGIDMINLIVGKLAENFAEILDDNMWTVATSTAAVGFEGLAPTRIFGGEVATEADLTSTTTLTVDEIDRARAILKSSSHKAEYCGNPLNGKYILLIHGNQESDLTATADWVDAQQYADVRGVENWLFQGGMTYPLLGVPRIVGFYKDVAIIDTQNCPVAASTGSPSVQYATAVMMGAKALGRAAQAYVTKDGELYDGITYTPEGYDYQDQQGIGARYAWDDKVITARNIVQICTTAEDKD